MKLFYFKRLRQVKKVGLYLGLAVVLVFVWFFFYWMIKSSLTPLDQLFKSPPELLPRSFTLRHYIEVFTMTAIPTYYINSLMVAGSTVVAVIIISTASGYALSRFRYPGKAMLLYFCISFFMVPSVMLAIPFFTIFKILRLIDNRLSLVIAYVTFSLPFSLWLLYEFFNGVPVEFEEAAMIDGASRIRAIIGVIIPQVIPGIIGVAIFTFIIVWNDLLFAMVLIQSESKKTLPLGISTFFEATAVQWGWLMATSVLVTIPILVVFVFFQRQLVQGFALGGVKE